MTKSDLTQLMIQALETEAGAIAEGLRKILGSTADSALFSDETSWVYTRGCHQGRAHALIALNTMIVQAKSYVPAPDMAGTGPTFDGPEGHLVLSDHVTATLAYMIDQPTFSPGSEGGAVHALYLRAGERQGVTDVLSRSIKALNSLMLVKMSEPPVPGVEAELNAGYLHELIVVATRSNRETR